MILTLADIDFDYRKPAKKFFIKHKAVQDEFEDNILRLLNDDHAEQINVKPLKGHFKGYLRIAIGGYRVIYKIVNGEIIVINVAYAGARGDIYKRFRG